MLLLVQNLLSIYLLCFFSKSFFTSKNTFKNKFETKKFFRDSSELARFIDKTFDKYDDHLAI